MDRLLVLNSKIKILLQQQLTIKRTQYYRALKSGQEFHELKKIFLEIKELESQFRSMINRSREFMRTVIIDH